MTRPILEPLAKLLRLGGHTVECAVKGHEAMQVMERFHPDCVILDLMMPVLNGFGFWKPFANSPDGSGYE